MDRLPSHIRQLLEPKERLLVSECADKYRRLDPKTNAFGGPWRTERTPYLRRPMDVFCDEDIRSICLMFPTQIGKSEVMYNQLAWCIIHQPGPAMFVYPRIPDAARISNAKLRPMFRLSPKLADAKYAYDDKLTTLSFVLKEMDIYLVGAGSPSDLAMMAIRYLWFDEMNKYPPFSGKEADPVSLASERTRTFDALGLSKHVKVSTPTTENCYVSAAYNQSDKEQYFVRCPHCDKHIRLMFSRETVIWPEKSTWEQVEADVSAYYECQKCHGKILDGHKPEMLAGGEWVAEKQVGAHVGFTLNALYSPFITFSGVAAQFLQSDTKSKLMNFYNSWLAKAWVDTVDKMRVESAAEVTSKADYARGVVPDECQILTIGVDWHKTKGLYWSAWAFAHGGRSWLVDNGRAYSKDELKEAVFEKPFKQKSGDLIRPWVGVDSGWNPAEVYKFTRQHFPQARPTKGKQTMQQICKPWAVDYKDRRTRERFIGFEGLHLDTNMLKDDVASDLAEQRGEEQPKLHFYRDDGGLGEFLRHLNAEHKIQDGQRRIWVPKYENIANHYLDTAIIARGLAEYFGRQMLVPERRKKSQMPKKRGINPKKGRPWMDA